ncbi:hypothetical protein PINS_up010388 [Pythium insidiosum]|nr:hypothetical protein PINS_up010388 [Pythium insidiosum]
MAAPDMKSCLEALQPLLTDADFSDCLLRSGLRIPARSGARADAIQSACDVENCELLVTRLADVELLSCSMEPFVSMAFIATKCSFQQRRLQEKSTPRPGCWSPAEPSETRRTFQAKRFLARSNRTSDSSRASSHASSRSGSSAGGSISEPRNSPAPAPPPQINTAAPALAPTTRTPTTRAPSTKNGTVVNQKDDSEKSSPAPIIIGVVVAVLVLVLVAWWLRRRCRREKSSSDDDDALTTARDSMRNNTLTVELLSKTHGTHTASTQASSATVSSHGEDVTVHRQAFHTAAAAALSDPEISQLRVSMLELLVGEKISHGAFGEVFLGEYRNVPVAIKRLSPQHRHDIKQLRSFLSEAKLTASLHHARIIDFVGVAWKTPTDVHVVTEYMSGGDLRSLLSMYQQQRRATGFNAHKLRIALHIVEALSYLHSRRPPVLHRDLKSRNVLLSTQHDAKLIDFGVSRERADQTMTAGVGTLRWMAPEVMQGGRYSDKADIFSFGVMLSELDTHRIPYNVDGAPMNDLAIITQVSMGKLVVEFSADADKNIVRLARACMAFDAVTRPSADQVLQILENFVERDAVYAM